VKSRKSKNLDQLTKKHDYGKSEKDECGSSDKKA
jgi:hypothetical protein